MQPAQPPRPDRGPAPGPDRLAPGVRPFVDAMADAFPDVGGRVTDAAEARRILAAAPHSPFEPPAVGSVLDREIPGPAGAPALPVRVYRPDPRQWPGPRPTVVFCHGGGWVLCDLDTHDTTARELCRAAGAVVVSVDYRRAPEARFPAAVHDAHAALCWAGGHLAGLGGDPGALVIAGDSAGGNLAAAALLLARARGGPPVALQVLLYPALAAQEGDSVRRNAEGYFLTATHLRWFWEQYLGPAGDGADPLASPLRADLTGLPPAHVVTAGCDPLHDEGTAYVRALREAGTSAHEDHHPGMFHGFLALSGLLPEARRALDGVGEAIARTVSSGKNCGANGGDAG
ncbi:alpha/beta hydrolase [Streptomyces sp. NBC_00536]|uniref:alpha/beta hydrolase n=1 Tax=Streptomyces sp. NBC_00536 TaxID=2975769 RepID=UPI002E80920F|nr:alpha/beta hydrolase [Streptomyces sp. NBC_00536]WUC77620.1 alpha/beta hydrolase [Streptomyces sp. NBC_00536]